jgi:hypothetical protein
VVRAILRHGSFLVSPSDALDPSLVLKTEAIKMIVSNIKVDVMTITTNYSDVRTDVFRWS